MVKFYCFLKQSVSLKFSSPQSENVKDLILFDAQCRETETIGIDHPYEKFLAGQKQRENIWKSARSKVALTPEPTKNTSDSASPSQQQNDVVAVLRQQLAAKTDECRHLINRLDTVEEANKKILAYQMQMQENLNKVIMYYLQSQTHLLSVGLSVPKQTLNS